MWERLCLILLVAVGGAGLTFQMAFNGRLRVATGSPVLTTIVSVLVTLVCLVAVWSSGSIDRGSLPRFQAIPFWGWCGGILGAYYLVIALTAIPRLGTATVFAVVIAGQMLTALAVDSLGMFGATPIPLSMARIAGTLLLLAGAILMVWR